MDELAAAVLDAGRRAGLDAASIAGAEPFADTRRHLEDRRARGLHGEMAFTYRNPARSTDPSRSLQGARALVVGARSYRRASPPPPAGPVGEVARYARRDDYAPLRDALGAAADVLRDVGFQARVLVDDNALVDRAAAHRAGLGWYGKNTNVLLPGLGSWFVLGSVVTDAPLAPRLAAPITTEEGCGTCERCLPACPTGALVAPGVLDARRCLAWLLQAPGDFPVAYRSALGGRLYGCDDCQVACPPNRSVERHTPSPAADPNVDEAWVPLLALLAASDADLLDRHGRWYIPERDPVYLRRNALVALGNVGEGTDAAVRDTLRRYRHDADPMLRSHAEWATAAIEARSGLAGSGGRVRASPAP